MNMFDFTSESSKRNRRILAGVFCLVLLFVSIYILNEISKSTLLSDIEKKYFYLLDVVIFLLSLQFGWWMVSKKALDKNK